MSSDGSEIILSSDTDMGSSPEKSKRCSAKSKRCSARGRSLSPASSNLTVCRQNELRSAKIFYETELAKETAALERLKVIPLFHW